MNIETRPNPEVGSIWAGWVISELYRVWPLPCNLSFGNILASTCVSVEFGDGQESFFDLMEWLKIESYVRHSGYSGGNCLSVTLSEKSLRLLNAIPSTLSEDKLANKIKDAASEVATEAGKSQLVELFGQFIGGIFKSVST